MADSPTTESRVRTVIGKHLGVVGFAWEAELVDHLGADSLDIVELAMALEEEFDVEVTDDQSDEWRTAGDILKTVEGLV